MEDEVDTPPSLVGDLGAAFVPRADNVGAVVVGDRASLDDAVDDALHGRGRIVGIRLAVSSEADPDDDEAWRRDDEFRGLGEGHGPVAECDLALSLWSPVQAVVRGQVLVIWDIDDELGHVRSRP